MSKHFGRSYISGSLTDLTAFLAATNSTVTDPTHTEDAVEHQQFTSADKGKGKARAVEPGKLVRLADHMDTAC